MKYKLIIPMDPYTFVADDYETAVLAVFSINTLYGAESKDGKRKVPIFFYESAMDWYESTFGRTLDDELEEKTLLIANALSSMMSGSFEDRRKHEAALAAITDQQKKDEYIAEWRDGCSSNIGSMAHVQAEFLRKKYLKKQLGEQVVEHERKKCRISRI